MESDSSAGLIAIDSLDGTLIAGLGRSVLRPYVCSEKNR
jgi:hypothetical protein